ncbi:MAG: hypothetical protein FWD53_09900, partial [Phycisphaerales bacterium]|nr:hypothetical protein [Phycisphaerales bacterium]
RNGSPLGAAHIELWAKYILSNTSFAGFTDEQWQKAHRTHDGNAGDHAERRALAGDFLRMVADVFPEAKDEILGAANAFWGAHDTVYEIWETTANTGPFDQDNAKFQKTEKRQTIAGLIRRLADADLRAAMFIDRAIKRIAGQDPGPAPAADAILDGIAILQKAPPDTTHPFVRSPENIHLPNAMNMLRNFLGEPFGILNDAEKKHNKLDYILWMGFSGHAFSMPDDGPETSNLPLVFDVLGYDYELWMGNKRAADNLGLSGRFWGWDDNYKRRVFWNLRDRRLPVLLFNAGDWPDWYLVTHISSYNFRGYGHHTGQGYRPNEPLDAPENPLQPIHLFKFAGNKSKQLWAIHLLAKRSTAKPSLEQSYQRAMDWAAIKFGRSTMTMLNSDGKEFASRTPFLDWTRMMQTDVLFPADIPALLKERREFLEGIEVGLAERRFYGAAFLELAAERLGRPEYKKVAEKFRSTHALIEKIWAQLGGLHAQDNHLRYADKTVRQNITALILQIEENETAAAKLLQSKK